MYTIYIIYTHIQPAYIYIHAYAHRYVYAYIYERLLDKHWPRDLKQSKCGCHQYSCINLPFLLALPYAYSASCACVRPHVYINYMHIKRDPHKLYTYIHTHIQNVMSISSILYALCVYVWLCVRSSAHKRRTSVAERARAFE